MAFLYKSDGINREYPLNYVNAFSIELCPDVIRINAQIPSASLWLTGIVGPGALSHSPGSTTDIHQGKHKRLSSSGSNDPPSFCTQ